MILGSAPSSAKPAGFDPASYHVVTVNASQAKLDEWGVDKPAATFIHFYNVEGDSENARAVRRVLAGRRTGELYVIRWTLGLEALQSGLAAFDYRYDRLHQISRYHRMALHLAIMRRLNEEKDNSVKFSNGLTAVFYALASGAPSVILSGIDPRSAGHFYNGAGARRLHAETDLALIEELRRRGAPIFTADPDVARTTGLDLWSAKSDVYVTATGGLWKLMREQINGYGRARDRKTDPGRYT
ncbi:hypothetical protein [Allomesorhizobium alhagi]|uniref:Putative membrane-anchored protein n=1 Tax=Mesorhizobium alhagi CCNWXJ12-2 TaxID=1107882 RepID=H0HS35_9HYPH|nr:hypothetical protein [Mesorhizobium alhagi]EHK56460.1 putative membrane-anchored protein [Mesorhizobium alhagi CCNWXJ12-2]